MVTLDGLAKPQPMGELRSDHNSELMVCAYRKLYHTELSMYEQMDTLRSL